jgi:hypothetical protein
MTEIGKKVDGTIGEGKRVKLHEHIRKVVVDLTKIDGKALRQVSSSKKDGSVPSLTISAELRELGLHKGDWVLIGITDKKIVIEQPE